MTMRDLETAILNNHGDGDHVHIFILVPNGPCSMMIMFLIWALFMNGLDVINITSDERYPITIGEGTILQSGRIFTDSALRTIQSICRDVCGANYLIL